MTILGVRIFTRVENYDEKASTVLDNLHISVSGVVSLRCSNGAPYVRLSATIIWKFPRAIVTREREREKSDFTRVLCVSSTKCYVSTLIFDWKVDGKI